MTDTAPLPSSKPDSETPTGDHDDFSAALVEFEAAPPQNAALEPLEYLPETSEPSEQSGSPSLSLEALLDVPVTVSAVLGRRKIDVASLSKMGAGSIIDLDRKVGDPVDLYINDQLIARGELVLADGGLGISMTEIIHPNTTLAGSSTDTDQE